MMGRKERSINPVSKLPYGTCPHDMGEALVRMQNIGFDVKMTTTAWAALIEKGLTTEIAHETVELHETTAIAGAYSIGNSSMVSPCRWMTSNGSRRNYACRFLFIQWVAVEKARSLFIDEAILDNNLAGELIIQSQTFSSKKAFRLFSQLSTDVEVDRPTACRPGADKTLQGKELEAP
jgi:hypothetical protein